MSETLARYKSPECTATAEFVYVALEAHMDNRETYVEHILMVSLETHMYDKFMNLEMFASKFGCESLSVYNISHQIWSQPASLAI